MRSDYDFAEANRVYLAVLTDHQYPDTTFCSKPIVQAALIRSPFADSQDSTSYRILSSAEIDAQFRRLNSGQLDKFFLESVDIVQFSVVGLSE